MAVAHVDMAAERERRRVGQPSKAEPFRGLDARGRVMCEFASDSIKVDRTAARNIRSEVVTRTTIGINLQLVVFESSRPNGPLLKMQRSGRSQPRQAGLGSLSSRGLEPTTPGL